MKCLKDFSQQLWNILETTREEKSLNIKEQMPYTLLGYNYSTHSSTKRKSIEILNDHLVSNNPFDIDINRLINNYTQEHIKKLTECTKE